MTDVGAAFVFEPMECRECGRIIIPRSQKGGAALGRGDALYQCECGFAYSNARDSATRTAFAPTPELNVLERYRPQLVETLKAAVNIGNRTSKASKFTYSTSEDAVTWTIFRWLQDEGVLSLFVEGLDSPPPEGACEMLFWGAPVGGQPTQLSRRLESICRSVDGRADRLTEPDVVIAWPGYVVFVEVKYQARNERKPDYSHFGRYTRGEAANGLFNVTPEEVATEGWYELTRNWRIGSEMAIARDARFSLVNLGPRRLTGEAVRFAGTISQSPARRFTFLSWQQLIQTVRGRLAVPPDIAGFVRCRGLDERWS